MKLLYMFIFITAINCNQDQPITTQVREVIQPNVSKQETKNAIKDLYEQPDFKQLHKDLGISECTNSCEDVDNDTLSPKQDIYYCTCVCKILVPNIERLGYTTERQVLDHIKELITAPIIKQCLIAALASPK